MKNRSCRRCRKAPTRSKHFNSKYCNPCRLYLLSRPRGRLTREQKTRAEELRGTMSRGDIAAEIGVSVSALKRSFRGKEPFWFKNGHLIRRPELTKAVVDFYSEHGMPETIKRFPHVKVKSVIYRYHPVKPRLIRWTDVQIIEAVKMAGLVSPAGQAKFFGRPNAYEGSIKSLWMKRFGIGGGCINGMAYWTARGLVNNRARYIKPLGTSRTGDLVEFRKIILWVDMVNCLKRDIPKFIRDAITTLAEFQRWLWRSNNPKPLILKMIREREVPRGEAI